VARKIGGIDRILGRDAVASIIYGEVSSSLYFALGVVALWALDLTPVILLGAGVLFLLATATYAEGVAALNESGGGSAIVRRAFGDLAGFVVGWAVILDFVVIIALSLLFIPHYAVAAVGHIGAIGHPEDGFIAVGLAALIGVSRLVRRTKLYRASSIVAGVDLAVQLFLAVLGLALVFDLNALTKPLDLGVTPTWNAIAYSIPLSMVAFAGIEIVATLIREAKKPDQALARDALWAVTGTVIIYAVVAAVALSAFPVKPDPAAPSGAASQISTTWINAPLAGVAKAVGDALTPAVGDVLRAVVALSAIFVLFLNATTAFSGATRVLRALGEAGAVPTVFSRPRRRSLSSPGAVILVVAGVAAVVPIASLFDREVTGLVSIYAFGILLAFMATFMAVVWLRLVEPALPRPIRLRWNFHLGRSEVPVAPLLGFGLSWTSWLLVLGTHRAARIVPPLWLAAGLAVYVVTRRANGIPILGHSRAVPLPPPEVTDVPYGVIVVPVKQAGPVEEEMLAIACKLAQGRGDRVLALKVIEVPLAEPLDVELPGEDAIGEKVMALARSFGPDYGVTVETKVVRGRAISSTIVAEAKEVDAGLILVGAVPRPTSLAGRKQIFSETVENLLRRADGRVIVTAFPPGTAVAEDGAAGDGAVVAPIAPPARV
jgi:basic amino acid/polyamine antiporter, APA family